MNRGLSALITACIATVISFLLSYAMTPIFRAGVRFFIEYGLELNLLYVLVTPILDLLRAAISMLIAQIICVKAIERKPLCAGGVVGATLLSALISLVVFFGIGFLTGRGTVKVISIAIYFAIFFLMALAFSGKNKKTEESTRPLYGAPQRPPYGVPQQPIYGVPQQPNVNPRMELPGSLDDLHAVLLGAIRPSLRAPATAILCTKEELRITPLPNGMFQVEGYVNSQNGYGALIATDFSATVAFNGTQWIVINISVGQRFARNYAKNFAVNYIVISIFVAVMGILGYFILSMVVGF